MDWLLCHTGIGPWPKSEDRTKNAHEGNYVSIKCEEKLPVYYGPTTFKWYTIEKTDDLREVVQDDRVFIDAIGKALFFLCKVVSYFCKLNGRNWDHVCVCVCLSVCLFVASLISETSEAIAITFDMDGDCLSQENASHVFFFYTLSEVIQQ